MIAFALIVFIGYLLGSIPSAVWVGKLTQGIDVREHGSGNAGATNTFRVLGWKAGTVVSIIDFLKGFTATVFVTKLGATFGGLPEFIQGENFIYFKFIVGISAVIGHTLPVFAQFRGGKGMLTSGGMLFGVEPISISFTILTFILVMFISRYVSLASIVSSIVYPIYLLILKFGFGLEISPIILIFAFLLCAFLIYKHRANVKRLLAGNENRIESFKPSKDKSN